MIDFIFVNQSSFYVNEIETILVLKFAKNVYFNNNANI